MNDLRKQFPASPHQIYLNTASSGLMRTSLYTWRNQLDKDFLEKGADYVERKKIIEETRETVRRFYNAKLCEVALVPNFSFGFNTLVEGMPKGTKILLLEDDYPSLTWPIFTRDFDIKIVKTSQNLEANIIKAIETFKPDYFLFSVVQWLSGIKLAASFLEQLKEIQPDLLLVADGTQYLGSEIFDFKKSPIDAIGGSGYKWMLSGFGNGLFLIKESFQKMIFPSVIGFNSAATFESKPEETTFIKHFEPGHQAAICYGSLSQSLQWFENTGKASIEKKIQSLTAYAKERFAESGYISDNIVKRAHSSIFNLDVDEKVYNHLMKHKIKCSLRGGGVRVSFHCYNTMEEIDMLCDMIAKSTL